MLTPLQRQIMAFLAVERLTDRELCDEVYNDLPEAERHPGRQASIGRAIGRLQDGGLIISEWQADGNNFRGCVLHGLSAKGSRELEDTYTMLGVR